jgi:hypothetical protein
LDDEETCVEFGASGATVLPIHEPSLSCTVIRMFTGLPLRGALFSAASRPLVAVVRRNDWGFCGDREGESRCD